MQSQNKQNTKYYKQVNTNTEPIYALHSLLL